MTALVITLGLVALLLIAAMVPAAMWGGAPDRRGEVRHLRARRDARHHDDHQRDHMIA